MPGNDLRLLALDGGGVRGLSALMILEHLMKTVNPEAPPKPCDYFDMIGGTSTGGLIAIMLGRLRMSVADCINEYTSLSDEVFRKTRHRVKVNGKLQGRFDAEKLKKEIKGVVKKQELKEDELLKDIPEAGCKVFVCATSKTTNGTVCLTSYRTPRGNDDLFDSVSIWEACRATSAATTFFEPIAIGRFEELFIDGATGANNPVRQLWDQAQLAWGPEPLEQQIKCLVSIGTGLPSSKPFKDDALHILGTLTKIATDTERMAEEFRRERVLLDNTGRYYRFNARGLEDIGLEEAKKVSEIAAATRGYIESQEVYKQVQSCAANIASREYFGVYRTTFSLDGVPKARQFVDRPAEMSALESVLLLRPGQSSDRRRQKTYILHGLGGMGKTQLAVEFARRHHRQFSTAFWLDGRSEDTLNRSIARCASRIPQGQIPETSRTYAEDNGTDIAAVIEDVMNWLARPDNTDWLLIFDNVDREYKPQGGDPDAYDVRRYMSGADHGSVLVTTRLARLEQLGDSQQLTKVSKEQGQAIFRSWYKKNHDAADRDRLLTLLDGLPLAIAQAGAYLQESGQQLTSYIQFYEQQWSDLMESDDLADAPLQDYPNRSVWTTWAISYQAIRNKDEATTNLLLLWSFLDNKDLWFGLFAEASEYKEPAQMLSAWVGDIASSEIKFSRAMQLLRNYSLVEETIEAESFATHPVVHQWARHSQGKCYETKLCQLAIVTVGWALPEGSAGDYYVLSRRLLSHAQACFSHIVENKVVWYINADERSDGGIDESKVRESVLDAANYLGSMYRTQGKLGATEQICKWALRESEILGPTHISTLHIVNNLGILYRYQGKLGEAEQMYERALRGCEELLGPTHISTLNTVNNLGNLYKDQGKLGEAEQMYERALRGKEELLGPTHISTLDTVNNLGLLYVDQGKLGEAEQMYKRALRGKEELLGPTHISTLQTVNNLGILYKDQGKLGEAEQMYERALRGYEELLGPTHISTLQTVNNLGNLYYDQNKLGEAEQMYKRALRGYEEAVGTDRVEQYRPALSTVRNLGILYEERGDLAKAREYYVRARLGFSSILGEESDKCKELAAWIDEMDALLEEAEAQVAVPDVRSNLATESDVQNIVGAEKEERRRLRGEKEHEKVQTEVGDPQMFARSADEKHPGDQTEEQKDQRLRAEGEDHQIMWEQRQGVVRAENEHQRRRAEEEEQCQKLEVEGQEPPKTGKSSKIIKGGRRFVSLFRGRDRS